MATPTPPLAAPLRELGLMNLLLRQVGTLSRLVLKSRRVRIESVTWPQTFRSIGSAFQGLFPELRESVLRRVRTDLSPRVGQVEEHEDFLCSTGVSRW